MWSASRPDSCMFSKAAETRPASSLPPATRQRSRRRTIAVAASVTVHLALGLLVLGSASGALVTGGAGGSPEESAITVSLSGIVGSRQASASPDAERLKILYAKALQAQSDVDVTPDKTSQSQNLAKLFDNIERDHAAQDSQNGTNGKSDKGAQTGGGLQGKNSNNAVASRSAATAVGPGMAASSGGLWGQIEPCWQQMPNRSAVPVTLQIKLDDTGRIARPPVVIRPDTTHPDQRRLIAEARALAAISACLPYHMETLRIGQRDFVVNFTPSAGG